MISSRPRPDGSRPRGPAIGLALLLSSLAQPGIAQAATPSEIAELVRLMRVAAPDGATVVASANGGGDGEPVILATLGSGPDGRPVLTVGFQTRVGLVAAGHGGDAGPGACDIVLQDQNADGIADVAEFHCDRVAAELPKALSLLRQPLFDTAVRALIRRLATV